MTDHVKIYGVKPRIQYVADGVLTTYDFPFPIFQASDIEVYFNDVKQSSATYTVQGVRDSDGGSVVFQTPPAQGTVLTLMRNLSIERTSDFQEGGALRADILNDELDYQIACQQQIAENLNRSLVLPPYAAGNDLDLTLPTPSAGKAIVWNNDGTKLENSTVAVNALAGTLNGYKTAAQNAAATATDKAGIATTKATQAQTAAQAADDVLAQLNGARANCLTQTPQNLDLVLSDGVLTLRAGSKIYVPNGAQNFTEIILDSDKTLTLSSSGTNTFFLFYEQVTGNLYRRAYSQVSSGINAPVSGVFYNTETNVIEGFADSVSDNRRYSLPLAIYTTTNGVITGIKQVFEGMGYIGNVLFALPGISGLIPQGKNADGTLNNVSFSTRNVLTVVNTTTGSSSGDILISNNQLRIGNVSYDYQANYNYNTGTTNSRGFACVGQVKITSGAISDIAVKKTFHAVDYNDIYSEKGLRCVVQSYKNSTGWYRIYSDGWVEQGGICSVPETPAESETHADVTLLVPMADTSYNIMMCGIRPNTYYANCENYADRISTSVIRIGRYCVGSGTAVARGYFWEVKGYKA